MCTCSEHAHYYLLTTDYISLICCYIQYMWHQLVLSKLSQWYSYLNCPCAPFSQVQFSSNVASPADETSADGHLFPLINHTGRLAVHHTILVVAPGLVASTLHSAWIMKNMSAEVARKPPCDQCFHPHTLATVDKCWTNRQAVTGITKSALSEMLGLADI